MKSRNRYTFRTVLAVGGVLAIALSACAVGAETDATSSTPEAASSAGVDMLAAPAERTIAALDIDEAAGVVRIATSEGVIEASLPVTNEPVTRTEIVGDRVDDVKSYERLGARILVSGHPVDEDSDDEHLGLWQIDAETGEWQPLAFSGEVDFHTMASAGPTPADGVIAAADSVSGTLYYSPDGGESWQQGAAIDATALAFTQDASALLAITPDGVRVSADRGQTFGPIEGAPTLQLLATPPVGTTPWRIVGATATGELWTTTNGIEWQQIGALSEVPSAIALGKSPDEVYAATPEGVFVTADAGATLSLVVDLAN